MTTHAQIGTFSKALFCSPSTTTKASVADSVGSIVACSVSFPILVEGGWLNRVGTAVVVSACGLLVGNLAVGGFVAGASAAVVVSSVGTPVAIVGLRLVGP